MSGAFDSTRVESQALEMRRNIVEMIAAAGSGHPGGSLSAADIVAALYFGPILRHDPDNPADPERDRFILSKGHAAPVLYAALAQAGYFPVEELVTLRKLESRLQGHPDSLRLPGVEVSTGSLGQGLSIAVGMALGLRMSGGDQRVFALLGDGELQEGQIWEAVMSASHYGLGNLIAMVDHNNLQIDGHCTEVMCLGDIGEKFGAFGWKVIMADGHCLDSIHRAITAAIEVEDAPVVIVFRTVKGKGVSYMEDVAGWHGKAPDIEETKCAIDEIDACKVEVR